MEKNAVRVNKIGNNKLAVSWNQNKLQNGVSVCARHQKNPKLPIKAHVTTTTGLKNIEEIELQPKKVDNTPSDSVQPRKIQKSRKKFKKAGQPHQYGEYQKFCVPRIPKICAVAGKTAPERGSVRNLVGKNEPK